MQSNDFAYMSVAELSQKLHAKELSPVEVVEASIERIEKRLSLIHISEPTRP